MKLSYVQEHLFQKFPNFALQSKLLIQVRILLKDFYGRSFTLAVLAHFGNTMSMTELGGIYSWSFVGYRRQTTAELIDALKTAIVAIDTNVLLDIYRYRPQTAEDTLAALEALGDRLVIPYQVVREFWRRHSGGQSSPSKAMKELEDSLEKNRRSIQDALHKWAKDLGVSDQESKPLIDLVSDQVDALINDASGLLKEESDSNSTTDRFIDRIARLAEGRVTPRLPDLEWEDCVKEGKRRVSEGQPPGYMDAKKEESDRAEGAAGDYLVWYHATRYASTLGSNLLLITRDQKQDWWWRQGQKFLGPRPELSREFAELSGGHRLFFMRPQDLLDLAPNAIGVSVSEESRQDAESVAHESEEEESIFAEWTFEPFRKLLETLDAEATVQAQALREAAHDPDRRVLRERIYELGEYEDDRMLRGFTRPFKRLTEALQESGELSTHVRPIFWASYPHGVKASWFTVAPEVPELLSELEAQSSR